MHHPLTPQKIVPKWKFLEECGFIARITVAFGLLLQDNFARMCAIASGEFPEIKVGW